MSLVERMDHAQRRFPVLGFPLAVLYKFFDDGGPYLAALMAYYAFLSVFPLLILAATTLSIVLVGHQELQEQILRSAVSQFPVIGDQLGNPQALSGGMTGVVVGLVGSIYGGLGVAQSFQHAMNTLWSVPRNSRPNPFKQRAISLLLLVVAGLAIIAATVLSTIGGHPSIRSGGAAGSVFLLLASLLTNSALFLFALRVATGRHLTWRQVLPGALLASLVYQALQLFGVAYVSNVVATASTTNSIFALVLGMLAFMHLAALGILLAAEVNVVRVDRLHPRALLTPFTDEVDLTPGDRRAYTKAAQAQRAKGQETIDVRFGERPSRQRQEDDSPESAPAVRPDATTRHGDVGPDDALEPEGGSPGQDHS